MSHTRKFVSLFQLLPLVSACSLFAQQEFKAIEIRITAPRAVVALPTPRSYSAEFAPKGNYLGYWNQTVLFSESCESPRWGKLSLDPGLASERAPGLIKFPLQLNTPEDHLMQLPAGQWVCQAAIHLDLALSETAKESVVLVSSKYEVDVPDPSEEDISVLQEIGVWDQYKSGHYVVGKTPYSFPETMERHPKSIYYGLYWSDKFVNTYSVPALSRDALVADVSNQEITWGPSKGAVDEKQRIDNIEEFHRTLVRPEDLWLWKTINYLHLGDFRSAQESARHGLKAANKQCYRDYFNKILHFKSESDYLKQYKSVRRVSAAE